MPLRDDILTPIPGDNPSGKNLKYDPIYDKIKEARREDDDAPQGDWQWQRKVADWNNVLKLTNEALATKSKDLQLAAWATEALLKKESFGGLRAGIGLLKGLVENFWDTVYPEIEDGDLELRAAPLEWVGTRLDDPLKKAPLCKAGHGFFKYKESRSIGYEEDADQSETKREARMTAIADGKLTAEDFDKAFNETSKDFYERIVGDLDGTLEDLGELTTLCEEKFGDYTPSFSRLREAMEEVRHTANGLYQKKRELAGEKAAAAVEEAPAEETWAEPEPTSSYGAAAAAPARAPVKKAVAGIEPADLEEVPARLAAVAKFLREQDGYSPAPYLMLRGYRWGEIRAGGSSPNPSLLEAPPTEVRQQLKRAMIDNDWPTVLEVGETAMAQPCGRGWLDLQRYVVTAAENYGYSQIAAAITSEVAALLKDMPELRTTTMLDDTPTANPETQQWLEQIVGNQTQAAPAEETHYAPAVMEREEQAPEDGEPALPDSYELAMQAVRSGRPREGIEILAVESTREASGRARFQRRLQLAELCMKIGEMAVAQPILEELLGEIDEHKLEEWESSDVIAYPLTMLMQCVSKLDRDSELKHKLYSRICRLDPVQALKCKP